MLEGSLRDKRRK